MSGKKTAAQIGAIELAGAGEFAALMQDIGATGSGDAGLDKSMQRAVASAVKKYVLPYLYDTAKREYVAKSGAVEASAKVTNAKAAIGPGRVLRVRSNRMQVVRFDVNPTSPPPQRGLLPEDRIPGPIVTVRRGELPTLMRGVIVAKMDSGHVGLFERLPGTKARPKTLPSGRVVVREKIRELISLSLAEMIRAHGIGKAEKQAQDEMRKEIFAEIQKSVNKAKKRYQKKMAKQNGGTA